MNPTYRAGRERRWRKNVLIRRAFAILGFVLPVVSSPMQRRLCWSLGRRRSSAGLAGSCHGCKPSELRLRFRRRTRRLLFFDLLRLRVQQRGVGLEERLRRLPVPRCRPEFGAQVKGGLALTVANGKQRRVFTGKQFYAICMATHSRQREACVSLAVFRAELNPFHFGELLNHVEMSLFGCKM